MTNKEKYPDATIDRNRAVGDKIKGEYFIKLKESTLLLYDGTVGLHDTRNPDNSYYRDREQAQKALDEFMNNEKQITLAEIKAKFEKAKKLIGKKIKDNNFIVQQVHLIVDDSGISSYLCDEFLEKNGFVIILSGEGKSVPYTSDVKVYNIVTIKAHDGLEYEAEDDGKCWKFGCAEISKNLIKQAYQLMDTRFAYGNREVRKITIGACDFEFDTLKQLVELDKI